MSMHAKDAVKEALLVGNFEAAVECCLCSGNLINALVLERSQTTARRKRSHVRRRRRI